MLDALLGRKGGKPAAALDAAAKSWIGAGLRADQATYGALLTGIASALLFYLGRTWAGFLLVVISGGLDAIDGRVARLASGPTVWGGVLDLTFDRIVEAAVLLGIALPHPEWHAPALVLAASWYINLGVFLAVGAASDNRGEKVIHYPPGLVERGEALLFAFVVVVVPAIAPATMYLYAILELATAAQRFVYGRRSLAG